MHKEYHHDTRKRERKVWAVLLYLLAIILLIIGGILFAGHGLEDVKGQIILFLAGVSGIIGGWVEPAESRDGSTLVLQLACAAIVVMAAILCVEGWRSLRAGHISPSVEEGG